MTIFTDVENSCYQIVKAVFPSLDSNEAIIFSYQNGFEPTPPYCMIQVINHRALSKPEIGSHLTGSTLDGTVVRELYESIVRFSFVGQDNQYMIDGTHAGDMAADFALMLVTPQYTTLLRQNGLSLMRKGTLKRVPKLRETRFFQSYEQDFTFAFVAQTIQTAGPLESVSATGSYPPTEITQEITVP